MVNGIDGLLFAMHHVCSKSALLPEGEHVGVGPGVEERDLDVPVNDRARLADHLVEPWLAHHSIAVLVNIEAVGTARWLASIVTRNRVDTPGAGGAVTKCKSRA